jgi:hypothetical protein
MLGFALILSLAFYTGADDSVSLVSRTYSDIDIRLLIIVGFFVTAFFLGWPFGVAIAFLLKVIGYSARLIPELETETDRVFYEGGVDDRLSDYDFVATNCLSLWR